MSANLYSELRSAPEPLALPQRALAIGAHPDDIEFGCGGTLAGWAASGCAVTMLIVTDGSKGSWNPEVDPEALAARRAAEQRAAAAELGAVTVATLDYIDGELEYSMELRRRICRHIRLAQPEVILSHDPWQRYQVHPDHRVTGLGAVDGMVAARDPLFYPDMEVPAHRPRAMLLWSADEPDYWHDIAASIDTKIAALLRHVSQSETTMGAAHESGEARAAFAQKIKDRASQVGSAVGLDYAEAFKQIVP